MRRFSVVLRYLGLTALALFTIAPFVWMILVSLHPSRAPIPEPAKLIPNQPQFSNYGTVLFGTQVPVDRFFINSVVVTVACVLGQVLFCSMAGFGFSRYKFAGKSVLFSLFVGSMMLGGVVTQIPVFLMMRNWGWLDTYWALIVPGVSSAFSVFLLRQFFSQLPLELDEAAVMDGASDWTVFTKVCLPLAKPALATCATFGFIGAWTDFFWPLLATQSTSMRTLEVGLSIFKDGYGGSNWPLQMVAAVVTMTPALLIFLAFQKYFVRGLVLGSIKG